MTPKDRPAPGCATVKPQRLPRRRARRSCCLEKCVCPRQTVARHCFSMTQTSGNAPVPSCLLSGGFPLPSGCASRLQDISYLLFSHSSVSRKRLCPALLGAPVQQPEQSRSVPGKCSLQLDSQRAAGGNSTASQKTVHRLQNTLVCNCLPPLMGQKGKKDPTQPSGLISIHLPHCYGDGKMAPRPFQARAAHPAPQCLSTAP